MQEERQLTIRAPMGYQTLLGAWVTSWSAAWQEVLAPLLEVKLHTRYGTTCSTEDIVSKLFSADLSDALISLWASLGLIVCMHI